MFGSSIWYLWSNCQYHAVLMWLRIVLSRFVISFVEIWMGIVLNVHIGFVKMTIFSVCYNPRDLWTWEIFTCSYNFFNFFKHLKFSSYKSLACFCIEFLNHILYYLRVFWRVLFPQFLAQSLYHVYIVFFFFS